MVKNNDYSTEEVGNWNTAKRYSDIKIMNLLESIDRYENIAQFGFSNVEDVARHNKMDMLEIQYKQYNGFQWLVYSLLQLTGNTAFAIKNNRTDFDNYYKKLIQIQNIIPKLAVNISSNKYRLKKSYYSALEIVKKIKNKLNLPLNKNNLIFMNREQIDPKKIKEQIIEDATTKG